MEPKPAAIAVQSSYSYAQSLGVDRVHKLAKEFGLAKSKEHRDDEAAARIGKELGMAIRIMRTNMGYTMHEMANECDTSLSYYKLVEDGARVPSISIINRAFSFLGVDILPDILQL